MKRSDIAEEVLNGLDSLNEHFNDWRSLDENQLFFCRDSKEISVKDFKLLDKDEQETYLEKWDKSPYEIANYLARGNSILDELSLISSKVARLQDSLMVKQLEELREEVKIVLRGVFVKHFPPDDFEEREEALKGAEESPKRINHLCQSIHSSFVELLMFNQ